MSEPGPVGIGLCVAFAVFMVVLVLEVYYVWVSRHRRTLPRSATRGPETEAIPGAFAYKFTMMLKKISVQTVYCKERVASEFRRAILLARRFDIAAHTHSPPATNNTVSSLGSEVTEEDNGFKLDGLWGGPSRLLFTITEETREDMEMESVQGKKTKASSECPDVPRSAVSSRFHTPACSPPFASPVGSPDHASTHLSVPDIGVESSSSLILSSLPGCHRHLLRALFEESSSSLSSSATASSWTTTPIAVSPTFPLSDRPRSLLKPKQHRRTLGLLFDPPLSPSSSLYHYHYRSLYNQKVHPHVLELPCINSHSPERKEGSPILAVPAATDAKLQSIPQLPTVSSSPSLCLPDPSFHRCCSSSSQVPDGFFTFHTNSAY